MALLQTAPPSERLPLWFKCCELYLTVATSTVGRIQRGTKTSDLPPRVRRRSRQLCGGGSLTLPEPHGPNIRPVVGRTRRQTRTGSNENTSASWRRARIFKGAGKTFAGSRNIRPSIMRTAVSFSPANNSVTAFLSG